MTLPSQSTPTMQDNATLSHADQGAGTSAEDASPAIFPREYSSRSSFDGQAEHIDRVGELLKAVLDLPSREGSRSSSASRRSPRPRDSGLQALDSSRSSMPT